MDDLGMQGQVHRKVTAQRGYAYDSRLKLGSERVMQLTFMVTGSDFTVVVIDEATRIELLRALDLRKGS